MIRVVVSGAAGRMGETVCEAVEQAADLELAGKADPALHAPLADLLGSTDVVVDFTTPEAATGNVRECLAADVHAVVGTTGFELESMRGDVGAAARDGRRARVFVAPNFAVGAVLMMQMARLAAPHMPECEIVELHHEGKQDAPSGTARATAERLPGEPPIHSVRLPGLVAHQEVLLGGDGQLLTIRHDTLSREAFVPGVLLALERLRTLPPGLTVGLERLLET